MVSMLYGGEKTSLLPLTAITLLRKLCNSADILMGSEADASGKGGDAGDPDADELEGPVASKE
eukprot:4206925-Pyramimonas_sp.AAC.1